MNCTESTDVDNGDLVILSALRAASAFLCVVITVLLLATISIRLEKSLLLNRLLTYLTIASLLTLLANTSQAVSAVCYTPWYRPTCMFVGFSNQFTAWLLLLVSSWLMCILSLRYLCPNNRAVLKARGDIVVWIGVVLISIAAAVIPLGTKGYGLNQAWCWLREDKPIEQWLLWHGWATGLTGAVVVTMTVALYRSEKRMKQYYESSRGINSTNQQKNKVTMKKIRALISYLAIYWVLITTVIVLYQIPQVKRTMAFLVIVAILEPLSIVVIPVVFIVQLQETNWTSSQRVQGANFQHCDGEILNSIQGGRGGGMGRKLDSLSSERQEELRESLLFTMEFSNDFYKGT